MQRIGVLLSFAAVAGWLAFTGNAAHAQPRVPPAVQDLLMRFGTGALNGQRLLFGDLLPPMPGQVQEDKTLAALMAQARQEDVVVSLTDALFSNEMVAVGLWQSGFFLQHYGTALFLLRPYDDGRIPVVMVHGINGSPRDFAEMTDRFAGTPFQPVCFFYPTGMALGDAARQLGTRLAEFAARHPAARGALIGHSMGGLVTKAMLDGYGSGVPSREVFVSIASPWAGIDAAKYANRLPVRPAAWDDLAPGSRFMIGVQDAVLPATLRFYLFFGARSSNRMLTPLGNNDGVLTLNSVLESPVRKAAVDVFGFYEDHVTLLTAPHVFERLEMVLNAELR